MNIQRWLVAIFIIALTISGLGFVKFQQVQAFIAMAESFPEPSATVNTTKTALTEYQAHNTVMGQAVATQVVNLQNELSGQITQVNFKAGDTVKKGQLLIALNSAEEEAQLLAAQANFTLAKNTFARMEQLFKQEKISQQEYDSAAAELAVTKANIKNLQSIIAKKHIVAPFDGTAGLDTYQVGQFLSANSAITTLVGQEPQVWVDFQLPQTHQPLAIGEVVFVKTIKQDATEYQTAKIIAKNSQVRAQSRHLSYRAELSNGRDWLQHNEMVKVKVLQAKQQVVLVPSSAINRDKNGNYLYTLKQDEQNNYRAHRVEVTLAKREHDSHIVLSGIEEDELIATDGAFKLRPGLLVFPKLENTLSARLLKGE